MGYIYGKESRCDKFIFSGTVVKHIVCSCLMQQQQKNEI